MTPIDSDVTRRTFVKTAGAAAAVAATGIEGILAARRAPAYAQGTKLHIVRWVDFIPEADVELKRQMPEASKALVAWAFRQGIDEVFAVARPTNERAVSVARRLGMEWVGETEKYYNMPLQVFRLRPG